MTNVPASVWFVIRKPAFACLHTTALYGSDRVHQSLHSSKKCMHAIADACLQYQILPRIVACQAQPFNPWCVNTTQVLLPALRSDMASLPLPCDRLQPAATPHLDHDDQRSQDVHSQPLRANKTCTSQHADCSSTAGQYIAGHATSCMAASETEERNHLSSQLPAASKSDLMPTAGPASTSASEANSEALSASADDTPIQPRNKQTAVGTRISPNIGRRTTAFSCSEPDHQSVASSQQVTSSPAAEAGSPDSTVMHDAGIDSSPSMASESAAPIMGSQQAAPPMHDWLPVTMLDSQQNASAGHDQHSTPLVGSEQEIAMQSAHQRPNGSLVGAYLGSCIAYQERLDGLGWRSYLTCCVRLSVEKEPHRCAAVYTVT